MRRYTLCVALIAASTAQTVVGQSIRGRVLLPDSITPASGTTMVLYGEAGEPTVSTRAGADGSFVVHAERPGRYTLQVLRIGYFPVRVPLRYLDVNEVETVSITLTIRAVALDTIDVVAADRCRMRDEQRERFLLLWEQVRVAFGGSRGPDAGDVDVQIVELSGVEDGPTRLADGTVFWRSQDRKPEIDSAGARQSISDHFFGATPAETLQMRGYVRATADQGLMFDAPSADAFLSEGFLAAHCFDIEVTPREHPDWVGVRFWPVTTVDTVVEISGTIWMQATTAEPRRVDFAYANLRFVPRGCVEGRSTCATATAMFAEGTGGTLDLAQLASGEWFVKHWTIRTPAESYVDREVASGGRGVRKVACPPRSGDCRRVVVPVPRLGVISGTIVSVSRRGTEVYRDTDAAAALIRIFEKQAGRSAVHVHVQGIITNDAGQPVARAVVRVEAPVRAAITNDSGYFELRSLPAKPKTIVLRVTRPGYEPVRFGLPVVAGAPRQVRIVLNPLASEKR